MNFLAFPVMHWVVTFYFVVVVAVAVFGRATMGDEGERTCPLCAEEMDLTDRQLRPCKCGYEICVWCWHQIMDMAEKDDTEGRCPACRMPYDKEKIVGMADNCERMVAEINSERKLKSQKAKLKTSEGRKHLSSVRVIQRNLVYIIGIPVNLADEDTLERREFFGQYGKVLKVSISRLAGGSQHSSNNNTCSVYITYSKEEEAVRCIQSVHGFILEGRSLRACYGTTKYCHTWLRNMPCNNPDCLYLHDIGTQEDSFTKDEIISAYTRVLQIAGASNNSQRHSGNVLPPPSDEFCNSGAASLDKLMVKNVSNNPANQLKGSPPNSSSGRSSALPAGASWGLRVSNCRASDASTVNLHGTATQKADTFTGSSAFSSMVAGSAPTSALHAVGKTSAVTEETHTMHSNGRSRSLEYSKQCIGSICKTSEDKPAENVLDAARAVNSEDLPRQPSSTSSLDEVAHGCLSVDVTVQGLSSGLSSVDSDNIIGIEYPDISKLRSSVSGHLFSRSAGNAVSGSHQYSLVHGSDLIEPLTSLQLGKPASESKGTCVSRELSKWSTEFQAQGLPAGGSETDEVLIPVDQGFKLSKAFTHPLYLSNSCSPLKISDHSLQHIDNASTSHPVISDPRAEDGKVDEALLPVTTGGSALSNGLKENKFSTSASESNKFSDCSDAFSNIDKVRHLGGCNGDASKDDKTADIDLGENVILSNILSMDFDPWDDSLTCSLAELLSETDIPNGSLRSSSSRKPQNSSQSRFSFARQEDFVNQATCLEPFSDTEYVQERYFSPQDSLQNRESYGDIHQNGFVAYSFEGSGNLISSHSIPPPNKVSVSRAQISVPPGFTVPSRAPPPGFFSQQRIDHAFDSTASSGNQLLGGSSILRNQYQCQSPPLPGNIGSAGDVEFIDPAILAVGKGRFPVAGISNLGLDSGSTFQQQLMMSENDTRIRLLMQPSKSSHQNFQYSDHVADILSPLSDAYTRSRLVEHQKSLSSSLTHHQFPQMSSLQQSRNGRVPNSLWDSWNDIQTGNDLAMAEIVRNERLGLDKYPGYDELRFHRSTSGDLYNRAFGM
ncbi:uncharacterized protein LOC131243196 isoform X2 [Magnolia sinica]|uniref:uncharacterized protein LOC131243196 isoform X2 n=1 Tax=Magnolia sinica TaxID=86752 RepID=UPI00265914B8|nr:uncharacterized protein LOC131243196 isoform X2 [Magnolia sinica]